MNYSGWQERFGLQRNPFRDTLDTGLFFRTRQHEEALIKIAIGIEDGHALILLTGAAGTGKTLASQVILRELKRERFAPALVFVYPGIGKGPLLGAILADLDVVGLPRYGPERLVLLQEKIMELHAQGRRLLVLIDEAHFLKAEALHLLRTLSNLETEQEKLVTVLLVGEESLRQRLRAPSYSSLRSRITLAVSLKPLSAQDTEQYIKYRLLKCGGGPELLTAAGYEAAHRLSKGVPRQINQLLYNGFIEALAARQKTLSAEILEQVEMV